MSRLPPDFAFLEGKILSSRVYPEFFSLGQNDRVLNVGFGDGPQAVVYAGKFREMVGLEIQPSRIARARQLLDTLKIEHVQIREGNVEKILEPDASFETILAIDIIEHVERPEVFLSELLRVLKPGGRLLLTFPAMHDRFQDAVGSVGRVLKPWKKREAHPTQWHPDHHQHEHPVPVWRKMTERAGFGFVRSRATTMFPPLHLYGIPRFWFSNEMIHRIDRWLADRPCVQNVGQTVMVEFVKPSEDTIYYISHLRFPTEKAHGLQVAKMCDAFTENGCKITLVVPNRKTPIVETPEKYYQLTHPLTIVRLPSWDAFSVRWMPRLLAFVLTELSFRRAVRRWMRTVPTAPALVITRDQFLISALRRPDWRVIFEAHDISKTFFRWHRRLSRLADFIVTTNAWKRDEIIKCWGAALTDQTVSLPNAIDVEPYRHLPSRDAARQELGWRMDGRYAVYAGSFYAWKGVFVLAEASGCLPEGTTIVMIGGSAEDQEAMREFMEEKKLSRVILVPLVSPKKVLTYLAAADVLVLPNSGLSWNSCYTTSPIKLWEYCAAQRPVVASDLPSLRELVSDKEVVFVKPDDPAALAAGIVEAVGSDGQRVRAAWTLVEGMSWTARAKKLQQMWRYEKRLS